MNESDDALSSERIALSREQQNDKTAYTHSRSSSEKLTHDGVIR